jgi:hypothetical protein
MLRSLKNIECMTNQNSGEGQVVSGETLGVRPDEVMEQFSIKKDAYYDRIKFLGIKAAKDNSGKAYLSQEQFDLMKRLDQHIKTAGTMDGFILGAVADEGGDLAITGDSSLVGEELPMQQTEEVQLGIDEQLIRMAAQLKAQQLAMTPEIIRSLAAQMTEDDLPEDLRAMVKGSREAIAPKVQPSQLASQMLSQWREQRKSDLVTA